MTDRRNFLESFSSARRTKVDLQGLVSIDSGPELDVETLRNMRAFYNGEFSHGTTQKAFENAGLSVGQGGHANIIGHGHQGIVNTGRGNDLNPLRKDKFIGLRNEADWTATVATVGLAGKLKSLRICACDTGAGPAGAQLVFKLAKALKTAVFAPTGKVWASFPSVEPELDAGATWQTATPDMTAPPQAIFPPIVRPPDTRLTMMSFRDQERFAPVSLRKVRAVSFQTFTDASLFGPCQEECPAARAVEALQFVRFDMPFVSVSVPTTLITGECRVEFEVLRRRVVREFRIHNDSLLQDMLYKDVYYPVDVEGLVKWHEGDGPGHSQ